jgi:hypothetical protein
VNFWMRVALAAAVLGAVGAIVATIWVGTKVREETVVPNPYEAGLRHTEERRLGEPPRLTEERRPGERPCDLSAGPCVLLLPWSGEVTLELSPRPLRTMVELQVRAVVRDPARLTGSERVGVAFSMVGMEMGENVARLARAGEAWVGTAVLVRCPSGRKDWVAEVRVDQPGTVGRAVPFPFTVSE